MDPTLRFLEAHREEMLEDLRLFVEQETPSTHKKLLDGFARFLAQYAETAGGEPEIVPAEGFGDHVRVRWNGEASQPPIFLLGHYDTVWAEGTIEGMPFEVRDGVAKGPGIFDMKCGLVQGFWAVRALREAVGVERPIVFVCNSDEEVGSPTSRALIEEEARNARTVLVLEPSLAGALKTARKGVGRYVLEVAGIPSHAGLNPRGGVSAIEEMARLILELHGHTDHETGTTVNVGVVRGGTRYNVVAAEASAEVDVRAVTVAEAQRMDAVLSSLKPRREEARIRVEGGVIWPPMERTEKTAKLYARARDLAAEIGFDLKEGLAGGASDGCLCASVGAPTLDGLGAVGGGAHAKDEHVEVSSIPERAALVARLMETL
ncbi:MAG: M20 family metallopeptidase [Actinomycetota bacterium]|nr:M20 family metallopeptidase [Actinomycetota bacterium]